MKTQNIWTVKTSKWNDENNTYDDGITQYYSSKDKAISYAEFYIKLVSKAEPLTIKKFTDRFFLVQSEYGDYACQVNKEIMY